MHGDKSNTLLKSRIAQVASGALMVSGALALLPIVFRKTKKSQVVLITGGSRGLGLGLAERFGRSGAKLVLSAQDAEELTHARSTLLNKGAVKSADDILLLQADVNKDEDVKNLVEKAIEHFGRIDVLINNAGIIEVGPFEDQPFSVFQKAMDTNFFGAVRTIQAVVPHFLSRPSNLGDSAIVNIASIGGKFAVPHMLPYVASKFALVGFSEGLHAELRHKGIRVTTVCPGLMRTGGEAHAKFVGQVKKEKRWFNLAAETPVIAASVKHAANKIFDAVASGRAEITITPQAWVAARIVGLAPETTQYLASIVSEYVLPAGTIQSFATTSINFSITTE